MLCEGNCPCQESGAGIDDQEYGDPQENFDQDQEFDAKEEETQPLLDDNEFDPKEFAKKPKEGFE